MSAFLRERCANDNGKKVDLTRYKVRWIHFSAVIKATDRLKKEMIDDRKLPELIGKINSNFKG